MRAASSAPPSGNAARVSAQVTQQLAALPSPASAYSRRMARCLAARCASSSSSANRRVLTLSSESLLRHGFQQFFPLVLTGARARVKDLAPAKLRLEPIKND